MIQVIRDVIKVGWATHKCGSFDQNVTTGQRQWMDNQVESPIQYLVAAVSQTNEQVNAHGQDSGSWPAREKKPVGTVESSQAESQVVTETRILLHCTQVQRTALITNVW